MRFPSGKIVASYSHTDDQVKYLLKFSLFTGLGCGLIIGLAIADVLR